MFLQVRRNNIIKQIFEILYKNFPDTTILQTPALLPVTELLKTNECTVKTNMLLPVGKRETISS